MVDGWKNFSEIHGLTPGALFRCPVASAIMDDTGIDIYRIVLEIQNYESGTYLKVATLHEVAGEGDVILVQHLSEPIETSTVQPVPDELKPAILNRYNAALIRKAKQVLNQVEELKLLSRNLAASEGVQVDLENVSLPGIKPLFADIKADGTLSDPVFGCLVSDEGADDGTQ